NHEVLGGFAFAIPAADHSAAIALGIDSPAAEVRADPLRRNGLAALAREFTNLVEVLPGVFFALEALDALNLAFRSGGHGCGPLANSCKNKKARVASGSGTRASELLAILRLSPETPVARDVPLATRSGRARTTHGLATVPHESSA